MCNYKDIKKLKQKDLTKIKEIHSLKESIYLIEYKNNIKELISMDKNDVYEFIFRVKTIKRIDGKPIKEKELEVLWEYQKI